jgi:MFS family permease
MFKPKTVLTEAEVKRGLTLVIGDGIATEAMTTLTGGAFLVAFSLLLGANNFQIGLLAALPTVTNFSQLISIWLVRKYNNRRAICVICSLLARAPLIVIGLLPLAFPSVAGMNFVIFFLFFFYLFGSIAGPSWNSWMKDLVPDNMLGSYFAKRGTYTQLLNVVLSLLLAFLVDYIRDHYSGQLMLTYSIMFTIAGVIGIIGAFVLGGAPEPQSYLEKENIFRLFLQALKDINFRKLMIFNSAWVFALNIATPFFTVFMMKSMNLSLSYIIALTIISQLCSVLTIRLWGIFADRYSNKTIIAISAPLYIICILAWCFVGIYTRFYMNLGLLVLIHIFTGVSTSGINLSLVNIGLKLAPKDKSIVYLSAKNIITAFFSSIAPILGGYLADFFTKRHLSIDAAYTGPRLNKVVHLLSLHEWNFLFLIGAALALIAVRLLNQVKETGEVDRDVVVRIMRSSIRNNLKDYFLIGSLINWHEQFWAILKRRML